MTTLAQASVAPGIIHDGRPVRPRLVRQMERRFGKAESYVIASRANRIICRNERGDLIEVDSSSWRLRVVRDRKGART